MRLRWTRLRARLGSRSVVHPALERQRQLDHQLVVGLRRRRLPTWSQVRYLGRVMSPAERRVVLGCVAVAVVAAVTLGWRAWLRASEVLPVRGGTYVEGLVGAPQYINPLLAVANDVDRDLARLIYAGLLRLDESGQLVPDLAEKVDVSTDGLTYTVTLRQDGTWHDGAPVTMDDVAFTVASLQDETTGSPLTPVWAEVKLEVVDDRVAKLTLPRPYPAFASALTVGLLPTHLWQDVPEANVKLTPLNLQPIGSGPFAFASFTRDRRGTIRTYTVRRHGGYHGQASYLDEVTFKFYADAAVAVEALRNSNVQGLGSVPAAELGKLLNRRGITVHHLATPQYTAAFFNLRPDGPLRQAAVRRALALAVDREALVAEAVAGQGQAVNGPIVPTSTEAAAAVVAGAQLDEARRTLGGGGWKLEGETWKRDKVELKLKILAADRPEHRAAAEQLRDDWAAFGVPVEVTLVPRSEFRDRLTSRDYEIVISSESLGVSGDPYVFWHSSQSVAPGLNLSGWSSREADTLLEQARLAADPAGRAALLGQFEQLIEREFPAVFLYSPTYAYPVSTGVRGVSVTRLGVPADRFASITSWYVKTERRWK